MAHTTTEPQSAAPEAEEAAVQPDVITAVQIKRKKKKKKYSKGMRDVQRLERRTSDASQRLARAVADGLSTYRKKRNKSARKKRDGALIDMASNVAQGMSKSMRVASKAPTDLAKVVRTKRVRRQVRALSRMMRPF